MIDLTVIIVEDEPPIARFIKSVLEEMKGFKVVAVCEDAYDGLAEIEKINLDILVTDIQMPGKNGLELIKEAKQKRPQVISVIISGFKIFEYAQEALKMSVYEYLLKPLDEEQIKNVFSSIKAKLLSDYRNQAEYHFQNVLEEGVWNQELQDKYFRFPYAEILLLHWNDISYETGKKEKIISNLNALFEYNQVCVFHYKDVLCIIIGCSHHKDIAFYVNKYIDIVGRQFQKEGRALYAVVTNKDYPLSESIAIIKNMYCKLEKNIGYEDLQVFYLEDNEHIESDTVLIQNIEKALYQSLAFGMWNELKKDYITMFSLFEQQKNSRNCIRKKLYAFIWKLCVSEKKENIFDNILKEMQEIFQYARTYGELMSGTWELIQGIAQISFEQKRHQKDSMKIMFDYISQYINENIGKSLFLNEICDLFGISQPYVSKIFRMQAGCSFKEYVLKTKIERAIQMMQQNPDVLIKDIAASLGFENPLYFSTVFKNVKGVPPSYFIKNL